VHTTPQLHTHISRQPPFQPLIPPFTPFYNKEGNLYRHIFEKIFCAPPPHPHLPGEEPSKGLLDESITFTAPGIGSYYFSMAAVTRVAQHMVDNPLAMYRLVPGAGLPSKAPPPQMTVNLPPNATQAQRMQVRVGGEAADIC
jgi:hypothetical protein